MIFVDSSVWIDYFGGKPSLETDLLHDLLGRDEVLTGDLVLVEVLQGCRTEADFRSALAVLQRLRVVPVGGRDIAVRAARNYRLLRDRGITVRKTIDTLIATRCMEMPIPLLYRDRDFDPFVAHLGLRSAMAEG